MRTHNLPFCYKKKKRKKICLYHAACPCVMINTHKLELSLSWRYWRGFVITTSKEKDLRFVPFCKNVGNARSCTCRLEKELMVRSMWTNAQEGFSLLNLTKIHVSACNCLENRKFRTLLLFSCFLF